MQLIDPDHPFYRPLLRRVLIVAFCSGWTIVELVAQQMFWVMISGAVAVYAAWVLLIKWKPAPLAPPVTEAESSTPEEK